MHRGLASIAGAHILIVEDNEVNQQVAYELLASVGFEVTIAGNGAIALTLLETQKFDGILMDVQMPVMDGMAATPKIRALDHEVKDIPIIALTAHAMIGDREKSLQAGMNDHITKPLDPEELFKTLVKWIKPEVIAGKRNPPKTPLARSFAKENITLPEIPGIDTTSALARVGGHPDAYIRLLKKFHQGHKHAVKRISDLVASGDLPQAREAAHSLKGVAGNIGAIELHQTVIQLERSIKEERREEWRPLLQQAEQLLNQLREAIGRLDTVAPERGQALIAPAPVPEDHAAAVESALAEIKGHLESNNFSAGKHVEGLCSLLEGSSVQNELMELKQLVDRYRFKDALLVLDRLKEAYKKQFRGEGPL